MSTSKLTYTDTITLPNSFLTEQAILNILLLHPFLVKKIISKIKKQSFYFEPHRIIYEILCELYEKEKVINVTTVVTSLQDQQLLAKIGGIDRIIAIMNRFENFSDLDEYLQILQEKYLRRLLIEFGKQIIAWGYLTSVNMEEIMENIEKTISYISQQKISEKIYSAAEIIDEIFLEMKTKLKTNESERLKTSFRDLDSILQGFEKSDLIIIAGRPSMGKTAFSLNLGKNIVQKYKIPLVIFTLEMSRQQILYRFLSTEAKIISNRIKNGKMTIKEWQELSKTMEEISALPIFIDDNPNINLAEIRSKLRKIFHDKTNKGIVIIDYLQLMKGSLKIENRVQEISHITRSLKMIAKEFEIPIIVLSQLSRGIEGRINKRPMLSDLRESGSIEQDADIVMMLYREDYYNEKKNNRQIIEVIIAKHRNGPVGTAKLFFQPYITKFTNIDERTITNAETQI
jgi:replicative DNA helicase